MSENVRRIGLGRGLAALLSEEAAPTATPAEAARGGNGVRELPVAQLKPNRYQPRSTFDETAMAELTASVKEKGILQPILVRRLAPDAYEIVAGERRWRAAQRAQLHTVPVLVREFSDTDIQEVALVENLQRHDLNGIEEAHAYSFLLEHFHYSQEQAAKAVGKSRAHIANTLRLLALPESVRKLVEAGRLSPGHGRALLGAADIEALAQRVADQGLSVRETERLTAVVKQRSKPRARSGKDADTRALEAELSASLGLRVEIAHRGGKGEVRIGYTSLEQLDEVCRRLTRLPANAALDEDPL